MFFNLIIFSELVILILLLSSHVTAFGPRFVDFLGLLDLKNLQGGHVLGDTVQLFTVIVQIRGNDALI